MRLLFVPFGLLSFALVFAGEPAKTGIVKGTITIEGQPTPDAVVSVEGLPAAALSPKPSALGSRKALIDQRDLKFIPRVLPVLVGTTVDFPNDDHTWHNVFSKSEAKKFDLGLYPPGESRSVTFDKPGVVRVLCSAHPNMEAYVVVKAHRYFARSDERGSYQISGVPLGKYRLEIWHPDSGTKVERFSLVRDGEVLSMDIDLNRGT